MAQVYSWWFMAWPLLYWCWSSSFHHPWSTPKGRVTTLSTSSKDARWHLGGKHGKRRGKRWVSLEKSSTNGGFSTSMWAYRRVTWCNLLRSPLRGLWNVMDVSENGGNNWKNWKHPPNIKIFIGKKSWSQPMNKQGYLFSDHMSPGSQMISGVGFDVWWLDQAPLWLFLKCRGLIWIMTITNSCESRSWEILSMVH